MKSRIFSRVLVGIISVSVFLSLVRLLGLIVCLFILSNVIGEIDMTILLPIQNAM